VSFSIQSFPPFQPLITPSFDFLRKATRMPRNILSSQLPPESFCLSNSWRTSYVLTLTIRGFLLVNTTTIERQWLCDVLCACVCTLQQTTKTRVWPPLLTRHSRALGVPRRCGDMLWSTLTRRTCRLDVCVMHNAHTWNIHIIYAHANANARYTIQIYCIQIQKVHLSI